MHEIALRYVDRFAPTVARMRLYLGKKVVLSVDSGVAQADADRWSQSIVERLLRVGLLNDDRWARSRTRGLRRRGKSARAIRYDLRIKGIEASLIDQVLEEDREDPAAELKSAAALARRRRLGPYARVEQRAERRQKHLASLARSGFSFSIARQVVDAGTVDDIADMIEELSEYA